MHLRAELEKNSWKAKTKKGGNLLQGALLVCSYVRWIDHFVILHFYDGFCGFTTGINENIVLQVCSCYDLRKRAAVLPGAQKDYILTKTMHKFWDWPYWLINMTLTCVDSGPIVLVFICKMAVHMKPLWQSEDPWHQPCLNFSALAFLPRSRRKPYGWKFTIPWG